MSSSSSTAQSDGSDRQATHPPSATPSRKRTVITWGLILLWVLLIAFGIVGQVEPQWLRDVSRRGMEIEVTDIKNIGDDAFRRGQLRQAITQYQHALSVDPDHVGVMVNLGIAWIQTGFADEGIRVLKEAIEKTESPISRGLAYYALGSIYEKRADQDRAIEYFEKAAACGTEVDKRCLKLGSLYLAGGKFEKARGAFQRALDDKLDIRRSYVEMLQHSLESLADDSTHVAAINRQLAQPPSDEEMARYDLDVIRQVQQHDREVAVTHNYLGWVDIQTDKLDQAAAHFEKSLQIWPGNRNASENLTIIREIQSGATPPGR